MQHCRSSYLRTGWAAGAILVAAAALMPPKAAAADLGGDCCADLEERIGELERSVARTSNRKMELTLSGTISQALLGFDDGATSDVYVVTNDNDGVSLTFEGEAAEIDEGPWSVGFVLEIDLNKNLSSEVSQVDDNGSTSVDVGDMAVWVKHEQLGTLTLGETKGASDATQEADLSKTEMVSYVGVSDVGGGFLLRTGPAADDLLELTWADVLDHIPGLSGSLVRYDTPELGGFVLSAAWGEDDVWDVGAKYKGGFGDFKTEAGVGFLVDHEGVDSDTANSRAVIGSLSVLHTPSGLSLSVAGGNKVFTSDVELTDGSSGAPDDVSFAYGKLGWLARLNALGDTAFYGEYGVFRGAVGRATSVDDVAGIAGIDAADVCGAAGTACFATDSDARIWGLGVAQHVEELNAQFYLGYRHQDLDLRLTDSDGEAVSASTLDGLDLVTAGMKLEF